MPAKYDESFRDELEELTSKYSDTELASIIGLARANVHVLRQRLKVKSFTEKTGHSKNSKTGESMRGTFQKVIFDRRFFQHIDTEAKAYFLGLIITDGCVHGSMHCVSIGLKRSDEAILECFCDALNLDRSQISRRDWILKGVKFPGSELYLSSSEMCEDLVSHGILAGLEKTTKCFLKTKLPEPLLRAFMRGVFDGDGSTSVSWTEKGTINSSRCRIFTASDLFCKQLSSIFDEHEIKHRITVRNNPNTKPLHCFDFGAVRSNKFLFWIYKDATIYLERKYNTWKLVLEKTTRPW